MYFISQTLLWCTISKVHLEGHLDEHSVCWLVYYNVNLQKNQIVDLFVLFVTGEIRLRDGSPDGSSGYVEVFQSGQNRWLNGIPFRLCLIPCNVTNM